MVIISYKSLWNVSRNGSEKVQLKYFYPETMISRYLILGRRRQEDVPNQCSASTVHMPSQARLPNQPALYGQKQRLMMQQKRKRVAAHSLLSE